MSRVILGRYSYSVFVKFTHVSADFFWTFTSIWKDQVYLKTMIYLVLLP